MSEPVKIDRKKLDHTNVASENLRLSVTPRMLERLQDLAIQLSIGERQLAATCLALGFAHLSSSVGNAPPPPEELISDMNASIYRATKSE